MAGQPASVVLKIKNAVRSRDGYACTICGMSNAQSREVYGRQLDVHRDVPGSLYAIDGCRTLCRRCHGPQPKSARGQFDLAYDKLPVPVARDLMRKVKLLAAVHGKTMFEFIDAIVRPAVEADFARLTGGSPADGADRATPA